MKITANMVTITRIVLMPIPGYLLYGGASELIAALVLITVLGLTDWVDGIMARRDGPSVLGGLLDPIADKIFIAVIYLPLTERGIIPIYMTAAIFARDFFVTALRTSLMLRDAPMRTSTLAKYKTAIQMTGIGYVILYLAHATNPDAPLVWFGICAPVALPVGLILYRLARGQKQGQRSISMALLMSLAVGLRAFLGPDLASLITLASIAALTVVSGLSYLSDTWSALKGTPGSFREWLRFGLEGLLVPILLVVLVGSDRLGAPWLSAAVILVVTLELAVGGLGNLIASQKITPKFRLVVAKSVAMALLAGGALAVTLSYPGRCPLAEAALVGALAAVSVCYATFSFWRHRRVYLNAI